jgi:hypothetical protein
VERHARRYTATLLMTPPLLVRNGGRDGKKVNAAPLCESLFHCHNALRDVEAEAAPKPRRLYRTITLGFVEIEFAIATYGLQYHSTPLPKSSMFLHVGPYVHDSSSIASPSCHPQKQVTTNIATFYSTCVFNFTIINIP